MVSSKVGWLVAGVLIVVVVAVAVWTQLGGEPKPTELTTWPGALEIYKTDVPITTILDLPTASGNSAEDYRVGVEQLLRKPDLIRAFDHALVQAYEHKQPLSLEHLDAMGISAVRAVLEGAKKGNYDYARAVLNLRMQLWDDRGTDEQRLQSRHIDMLYEIGSMTWKVGAEYLRYGKYAQAERCYKATLLLGYRMSEERVFLRSLRRGLALQHGMALQLAKLYAKAGKKDLQQKALAYRRSIERLNKKCFDRRRSKWAALVHNPPLVGDCINVARNDEDLAWRIEAIIRLGVCRFTASPRQQKYVNRVLEELSRDSEPAIQKAVQFARSLTQEDVPVMSIE